MSVPLLNQRMTQKDLHFILNAAIVFLFSWKHSITCTKRCEDLDDEKEKIRAGRYPAEDTVRVVCGQSRDGWNNTRCLSVAENTAGSGCLRRIYLYHPSIFTPAGARGKSTVYTPQYSELAALVSGSTPGRPPRGTEWWRALKPFINRCLSVFSQYPDKFSEGSLYFIVDPRLWSDITFR